MPSEIEKQSLEAHVEICSERYGYLEENMERIESRLTIIEQQLDEIRHNLLISEKNKYKSMWVLSGSVIAALFSAVIYLLTQAAF
jgi:septal ring factor EnvC (AmiA/AmiB activator)